MRIDQILHDIKVVPVIEIDDLNQAVPLAKTLDAASIRVIELTLRTSCALDALNAMLEAVPHLIIGMGTICTRKDAQKAVECGASFLVSPGSTKNLLGAFSEMEVPCIPGIATASEALVAQEAGFELLKFFPAEAAGGIAFLKSIAGPLPGLSFFPTGSITVELASQYIMLPNVKCVGGSWIAPKALIDSENWYEIKRNALRAASIGMR